MRTPEELADKILEPHDRFMGYNERASIRGRIAQAVFVRDAEHGAKLASVEADNAALRRELAEARAGSHTVNMGPCPNKECQGREHPNAQDAWNAIETKQRKG